MVNNLKIIALAGALGFVAGPALAQSGVPIVGDLPIINGLPIVGANGAGLDLDPFHIFTPAPAPAPAPRAAPMMMKKHHMMMHHHPMMMHHKMMMMHHKKMMMHHKMMMKKKM